MHRRLRFDSNRQRIRASCCSPNNPRHKEQTLSTSLRSSQIRKHVTHNSMIAIPTMSIQPFHPFDVLVTSGTDAVSRGIRFATCSPWSHVAMTAWITRRDLQAVFPDKDWTDWDNRTLVLESTSDYHLPCAVTGKRTKGLQSHKVLRWLANYPGKVYRLKFNGDATAKEISNLAYTLLTLLKIGVPYDVRGALFAGTRFVKWFPCVAKSVGDRQSRFCVETVESVLQTDLIGRKLPSFDPGRDRPRDLVRKLRHCKLWADNPVKIR